MNWKAYLRWLRSRIVVAKSMKDFEILDKLGDYEMPKLCGITPQAIEIFAKRLGYAFDAEKSKLTAAQKLRLDNDEDVEIVRATLLRAFVAINNEFNVLGLT